MMEAFFVPHFVARTSPRTLAWNFIAVLSARPKCEARGAASTGSADRGADDGAATSAASDAPYQHSG